MKSLLLSFFVGVTCLAQTLTLTVPAPVVAGQTANLQIAITEGGDPIAAIQWNTVAPTGFGFVYSVPSGEPKMIACNPTLLCVIYALNAATLPNGPIALASITIPAMTRGTQTVALSSVLGADAAGIGVPVPAASVMFTVFSPFDLNQDGKVDSTDLSLAIAQLIGTATCGTADFNHDGVCNVRDIVLLANDAQSPTP